MIINELKDIAIKGIACAVSTNWVSIESLKNGENDATLDKFVKTTSVQGHYECGPRQTAADLGSVAARHILEHKGIDPTDVGVLVYVTQYPDYRVPSTACVLQNRMGLSKDCIAFDVNLGCSGFVYGLNIIASLMQTGNACSATPARRPCWSRKRGQRPSPSRHAPTARASVPSCDPTATASTPSAPTPRACLTRLTCSTSPSTRRRHSSTRCSRPRG